VFQTVTFPVRFLTGAPLTYAIATAGAPTYKPFARVLAQ
jgi:hypothetical protein